MNRMMLLNAIYGNEKKMKKAQFKIQQMAFMILAVFLFFILVALFWFAVQNRSLHKEAAFLEEEKAQIISDFLSSSSEFSCSYSSYCIDTDKMMVLRGKLVYKEFWPVSFIKVRKTYPKQEEEKECDLNTYPDCNLYNIYENTKFKSQSSVDSFVGLCRYEKVSDYVTRKCELGKLIIGYEIK